MQQAAILLQEHNIRFWYAASDVIPAPVSGKQQRWLFSKSTSVFHKYTYTLWFGKTKLIWKRTFLWASFPKAQGNKMPNCTVIKRTACSQGYEGARSLV